MPGRPLLLLLLLVAGCGDAADRTLVSRASCPPLARAEQPLSVIDRSVVGDAEPYRPDASMRGQREALRGSQRLRRERAWQIAERVLTSVAPVARLPELAAPAELPRFQTWHGRDDLTRVFRRLYAGLDDDERASRARLGASAIDAAWRWNDHAIDDFEAWSEARRAAYVAAIDEPSEVHGLAGLTRVSYSPGASRHLLGSYPEILACRESTDLAAVESPDELAASMAAPPCSSTPASPACLAGAFPPDAAIVKASFRRADVGEPLAVYDTSASALSARLAAPGPSWEEPDDVGTPDESSIYALKLPDGNVYWLAGLHVITKELDDWYWLTLWWSPDPDTDFGADRPDSIPAPFDHYKLCSVVDFGEGDADAGGGFAADAPSLAEALAAAHAGRDGPTWCSNPYLEAGAGAALTNCLGCHQHAGAGFSTGELLERLDRSPAHGRSRSVDRLPSDYVFGLDVGDDLGGMFLETERHFAR